MCIMCSILSYTYAVVRQKRKKGVVICFSYKVPE